VSFAKFPISAVGSGRSRPSPSAPLEITSADQAVQQFAVASGVAEALDVLRGEGYGLDFNLGHSCPDIQAPGLAFGTGELAFDRAYRFEGASDPDDEAIVFAVRCPACGGCGVLVSAYGSGAPDVALIVNLVDSRATGGWS
jgi:hypothetical protein